MRWWALAWAAGLVCAAALLGVDAKEAVENTAAAQQMYAAGEVQVVGTMLAARTMYDTKQVKWNVCDLRLESFPGGDGGLRLGQVLAVQYEVKRMPPPKRPRPGDVVRATLRRDETVEGGAWMAVGQLEKLGRGELVKPGNSPTIELGSPQAKVLVKMLAPLQTECHQKTMELLKELAAREPDRLRVQIFDMGIPEVRAEMMRERLQCATVLVNNREEFTLGERKVTFSHRPNEGRSTYQSEDVILVVEQEIARLYAGSASGQAGKPASQ